MLQGSRIPDPTFDASEALYLRCLRDYVHGDRLLAAGIAFPRIPRTSLNRGKYSEPEDVLLPIYLDFGVLEIGIHQVPHAATKGDGSEVRIRVDHEPEPLNYSHSCLNVYDETSEVPRDDVSKTIKKKIRGEFARLGRVIRSPAVTAADYDADKSRRESCLAAVRAKYGAPPQ